MTAFRSLLFTPVFLSLLFASVVIAVITWAEIVRATTRRQALIEANHVAEEYRAILHASWPSHLMGCQHPDAVPVESTDGTVVARLCPACDKQLSVEALS